MGKRTKEGLVEFNKKAIQEGLTYAEAQMRETCSGMGRIRAPRGSGAGYMKASARNMLRKLEADDGL